MSKEDLKEVKKDWGRELVIVNCPKYCGKLLYLDRGAESSCHKHMVKQETFFCLEGTAGLTIEGKVYMLTPFTRPKTILPGRLHSFTGVTDAVILEVGTHHDDRDVIRLTESKAAKNSPIDCRKLNDGPKRVICDMSGIHYHKGVIALMDKEDIVALLQLVNSIKREKMLIAEVGSWMGGTTAILATVSATNGKVFAIDHWMGPADLPPSTINEMLSFFDKVKDLFGTWEERLAKGIDIYTYFKGNMIDLGVWDTIYPLVMDSATACKIFANNILDLVFIDGDHSYEAVKQDVLGWLPKVKDSGILCGHDANRPSVLQAVDECLVSYSLIPDSIMWYIDGKPLQEAKRRLKDE